MSLHDTLSRLTADKIVPELLKIVEHAEAGHSIYRGRIITTTETGDSVSLDFLAQTYFRSNLFCQDFSITRPCSATLEERSAGFKLRQKIADLYASANEMISESGCCTIGINLAQDYFTQQPEALIREAILNWETAQSFSSLKNEDPLSKRNELLGFTPDQFKTNWPGREPVFKHTKTTSTMWDKMIEIRSTEFYFASQEMIDSI